MRYSNKDDWEERLGKEKVRWRKIPGLAKSCNPPSQTLMRPASGHTYQPTGT